MTISKEEILELVNQLPDPVDVEDLIYRLYLREKLAAAEAATAEGRTLSAEATASFTESRGKPSGSPS